MFGYVTANRLELKGKDYDLYRSYYCGLCRQLRESYGLPGQISLTYDLTFVLLLLSGVYEPKTRTGTTRCIVHPLIAHPVRKNEFTDYAADMNVILAYHKCLDDWNDEGQVLRLAYAKLLSAGMRRAGREYGEKIARIRQSLEKLSRLEAEGETKIDQVAGCSGEILAEVLSPRKDEWESVLRRMGFYLGKFVYLMDAYEDVEKDVKNRSYNPLIRQYLEGREGSFDEETKKLLVMMLSDACREFESLPVLRHAEILRNILYSGVWLRFEAVKRKREKENA